MFRVIVNTTRRIIVIVGQKRQIRPRRRVARQVLDGAIYSQHPSVLIGRKPNRVVEVHLDEIFIKAVRTAGPATLAVKEVARRDRDVCPQQTGERLAHVRVLWDDQVGFTLLGEFSIRGIARQVGQTSPF